MTVVSPYIVIVDRNGRLTPEGVRLLETFVARDAATEDVDADDRLDALEITTAGLTSAVAGKQDTLVSATNIKTINGATVLGSGDLAVATDLSYTAATRVLASSTGADVTLPLVATGDAGLAPASGGGTANFLRADGTWAAPTASATATDFFAQSLASQGPGFDVDTYLSGSSIAIPAAGVKVGTRYLLRFRASKTAAGTAAPIITIRFGTAQTTADAARLTLTLRAQTAAADEGIFEVEAAFTADGASATLGGVSFVLHRQTTTGFQNAISGAPVATSAAFDATVASSFIGASVDGGTSAAWTVTFVSAMLLGTN